QLDQVNRACRTLSRQMAFVIFFLYYLELLALDIILFVVIDRKTDPFLRVVAISFLYLVSVINIGFFMGISSVSVYCRRVASPIKRPVYRCSLSPHSIIKLTHFYLQLKSDHVGISCYDIFTFSSAKLGLV